VLRKLRSTPCSGQQASARVRGRGATSIRFTHVKAANRISVTMLVVVAAPVPSSARCEPVWARRETGSDLGAF
jgi:hypothetical protein